VILNTSSSSLVSPCPKRTYGRHRHSHCPTPTVCLANKMNSFFEWVNLVCVSGNPTGYCLNRQKNQDHLKVNVA